MKKQRITRGSLTGFIIATLVACSQPQTPDAQTSSPTSPSAPTTSGQTATGEVGSMQLRANGEDFVRQGLVSKDGWQINFDHVFVSFGEATAYETDPPYNAETGGELTAKQSISLAGEKVVDLAEGDEKAEAILVNEVPAPPGRYNALSWKMTKAKGGPVADQVMVMEGVATKGEQTVPFVLKFDQELQFVCGDYVGDERKGILQPGGKGELEATFHFDHLFGDGNTPATEEPNTTALGFDPFMNIAEGGQLSADLAALKQKLSEADYQKLMSILPSIGHVGEGHCKETQLTTK